MNPKQGRILQNIKTDHFRQLFNQPKSSGTLPTKKKKKKIYLRFSSFLEFENRLFNIFSDFSKITEILKLKWVVSGSDLAPIKPKTTSLYLSRNNWSNSGAKKLPPKCFQPKTSKSPCICLGNEKWPKKSVCKWPKNVAGTLKTSQLTISDNFSINKSHQKPSQRLLTKKKKSQILPFLECENWLFNRASDFLEFSEIFKLEWIMSGSDLGPFLPQTTSLYLSRKNWSNSAT